MIQEKIFTKVLFQLQPFITQVRQGIPVHQLDMFDDINQQNEITIVISLNQIADPDNYGHARQAAIRMQTCQVKVKRKDGWASYQGLFIKVIAPEDVKRSNKIIIKMERSVAAMLVDLQVRRDQITGKITPINYTTFYYEYAIQTKNKYSSRIYKLLCSFRVAGGFYYSVDDLRDLLQLGTRYKDTEALKRRVLKPVQEELAQNSDVWFNMSDKNFEKKDGNKVVGFHFKVISDLSNLHYVNQVNAWVHAFKEQFKFSNDQVAVIKHIIDDANNWSALQWRIENKIIPRIKDNTQSRVEDVASFTLKSILNHFKEG